MDDIDEIAGNNGHDEDFGDWLRTAAQNGELPSMDGEQVARKGIQLVNQQKDKLSAYHYVIDELSVQEIYSDDKKLALLTRLLKRCKFIDRAERLAFLDYVDWCVEFQVDLDNAIRCLVSSVSEGRASIDDLIAMYSSFSFRQSNTTMPQSKKQQKNDKLE